MDRMPIAQALAGFDPAEAAARLQGCDGFAFLDSGGEHGTLSRWSVIGVEPFARFTLRDGRAFWNGTAEAAAPLEALRRRLSARAAPSLAGLPFAGGAIGSVDYEFDPSGRGQMEFGFYDLALVFDRQSGRGWAISTGHPETDASARTRRSGARLDHLLALLDRPPAMPVPARIGPWHGTETRDSYAAKVERVRDHIRAGDVYQANITHPLRAELRGKGDLWPLYEALRSANPAPFAACLKQERRTILSASPERYLRLIDGTVEARPIKGTAPRSPDPETDRHLGEALAASGKDRAENVMIVDLMRNDLSIVCRPGSVAVPQLCHLESYASVHQLTSAVTGRLADGEDALSLLAATFPGGSITGAPKKRAMEIIRAIEGEDRGVYCGAIGYIGFDGTMDLSIPIRTVSVADGVAELRVGGGITYLSDPAAEYEETLTKARRVLDALQPFTDPT